MKNKLTFVSLLLLMSICLGQRVIPPETTKIVRLFTTKTSSSGTSGKVEELKGFRLIDSLETIAKTIDSINNKSKVNLSILKNQQKALKEK